MPEISPGQDNISANLNGKSFGSLPDLSSLSDMELSEIPDQYSKIGTQFVNAAKVAAKNVGERQVALIGNDFGATNPYMYNTYYEPQANAFASSMRVQGTQAALEEGMKRGKTAAEADFENAKNNYNKALDAYNNAVSNYQNPKLLEFASDILGENTSAAEFQAYLDAQGMTQEEFVNKYVNGDNAFNLVKNWDIKDLRTNAATNPTLEHFGVSRADYDQWSQEKRDEFWGRADVGNYWGKLYADAYIKKFYGNETWAEFDTQYKNTVNLVGQTFDYIKGTIDKLDLIGPGGVSMEAIFGIQASTGITPVEMFRRIDKDGGLEVDGEFLSKDEILSRIENEEDRKKVEKAMNYGLAEELSLPWWVGPLAAITRANQVAIPIVNFVYNKYTHENDSHGDFKEAWDIFRGAISSSTGIELNASDVVTQQVGLDEFLRNNIGVDFSSIMFLRDMEKNSPDMFQTMKNQAAAMVNGINYVDIADGKKYYRTENGYEILPEGTAVSYVMPGALNDDGTIRDVSLKRALDLISQANDSKLSDEDREKLMKTAETEYSDYLQHMATASFWATMLNGQDTSALYASVLYRYDPDEYKDTVIDGKTIQEIINEFEALAKSDKKKAYETFGSIVQSTYQQVGKYFAYTPYFMGQSQMEEYGLESKQGVKLLPGEVLDITPSQAATLFNILTSSMELYNKGSKDGNLNPGLFIEANGINPIIDFALTAAQEVESFFNFLTTGTVTLYNAAHNNWNWEEASKGKAYSFQQLIDVVTGNASNASDHYTSWSQEHDPNGDYIVDGWNTNLLIVRDQQENLADVMNPILVGAFEEPYGVGIKNTTRGVGFWENPKAFVHAATSVLGMALANAGENAIEGALAKGISFVAGKASKLIKAASASAGLSALATKTDDTYRVIQALDGLTEIPENTILTFVDDAGKFTVQYTDDWLASVGKLANASDDVFAGVHKALRSQYDDIARFAATHADDAVVAATTHSDDAVNYLSSASKVGSNALREAAESVSKSMTNEAIRASLRTAQISAYTGVADDIVANLPKSLQVFMSNAITARASGDAMRAAAATMGNTTAAKMMFGMGGKDAMKYLLSMSDDGFKNVIKDMIAQASMFTAQGASWTSDETLRFLARNGWDSGRTAMLQKGFLINQMQLQGENMMFNTSIPEINHGELSRQTLEEYVSNPMNFITPALMSAGIVGTQRLLNRAGLAINSKRIDKAMSAYNAAGEALEGPEGQKIIKKVQKLQQKQLKLANSALDKGRNYDDIQKITQQATEASMAVENELQSTKIWKWYNDQGKTQYNSKEEFFKDLRDGKLDVQTLLKVGPEVAQVEAVNSYLRNSLAMGRANRGLAWQENDFNKALLDTLRKSKIEHFTEAKNFSKDIFKQNRELYRLMRADAVAKHGKVVLGLDNALEHFFNTLADDVEKAVSIGRMDKNFRPGFMPIQSMIAGTEDMPMALRSLFRKGDLIDTTSANPFLSRNIDYDSLLDAVLEGKTEATLLDMKGRPLLDTKTKQPKVYKLNPDGVNFLDQLTQYHNSLLSHIYGDPVVGKGTQDFASNALKTKQIIAVGSKKTKAQLDKLKKEQAVRIAELEDAAAANISSANKQVGDTTFKKYVDNTKKAVYEEYKAKKGYSAADNKKIAELQAKKAALEKKLTEPLSEAEVKPAPVPEPAKPAMPAPETAGKVEVYRGNWTKDTPGQNPDKVYLFGDNLDDAKTGYKPSKTQAVIRGQDNVIGIPTKRDRFTNEVAQALSEEDHYYDHAKAAPILQKLGYETGDVIDSIVERVRNEVPYDDYAGQESALLRELNKLGLEGDVRKTLARFVSYANDGDYSVQSFGRAMSTPQGVAAMQVINDFVIRKSLGKTSGGKTKGSYFTDADFDEFKAGVDDAIAKAKATGKTIVLPENAPGSGVAQLNKRAPKCWEYLRSELGKLGFDVDENGRVSVFNAGAQVPKTVEVGKKYSIRKEQFTPEPDLSTMEKEYTIETPTAKPTQQAKDFLAKDKNGNVGRYHLEAKYDEANGKNEWFISKYNDDDTMTVVKKGKLKDGQVDVKAVAAYFKGNVDEDYFNKLNDIRIALGDDIRAEREAFVKAGGDPEEFNPTPKKPEAYLSKFGLTKDEVEIEYQEDGGFKNVKPSWNRAIDVVTEYQDSPVRLDFNAKPAKAMLYNQDYLDAKNTQTQQAELKKSSFTKTKFYKEMPAKILGSDDVELSLKKWNYAKKNFDDIAQGYKNGDVKIDNGSTLIVDDINGVYHSIPMTDALRRHIKVYADKGGEAPRDAIAYLMINTEYQPGGTYNTKTEKIEYPQGDSNRTRLSGTIGVEESRFQNRKTPFYKLNDNLTRSDVNKYKISNSDGSVNRRELSAAEDVIENAIKAEYQGDKSVNNYLTAARQTVNAYIAELSKADDITFHKLLQYYERELPAKAPLDAAIDAKIPTRLTSMENTGYSLGDLLDHIDNLIAKKTDLGETDINTLIQARSLLQRVNDSAFVGRATTDYKLNLEDQAGEAAYSGPIANLFGEATESTSGFLSGDARDFDAAPKASTGKKTGAGKRYLQNFSMGLDEAGAIPLDEAANFGLIREGSTVNTYQRGGKDIYNLVDQPEVTVAQAVEETKALGKVLEGIMDEKSEYHNAYASGKYETIRKQYLADKKKMDKVLDEINDAVKKVYDSGKNENITQKVDAERAARAERQASGAKGKASENAKYDYLAAIGIARPGSEYTKYDNLKEINATIMARTEGALEAAEGYDSAYGEAKLAAATLKGRAVQAQTILAATDSVNISDESMAVLNDMIERLPSRDVADAYASYPIRLYASYADLSDKQVFSQRDIDATISGDPMTHGRAALVSETTTASDAPRKIDSSKYPYKNPFVGNKKFNFDDAEAVQAYKAWVRGDAYTDFAKKQRNDLATQFNNGDLAGRPVYYDRMSGSSEHATAVAELINEKTNKLLPQRADANIIKVGGNEYTIEAGYGFKPSGEFDLTVYDKNRNIVNYDEDPQLQEAIADWLIETSYKNELGPDELGEAAPDAALFASRNELFEDELKARYEEDELPSRQNGVGDKATAAYRQYLESDDAQLPYRKQLNGRPSGNASVTHSKALQGPSKVGDDATTKYNAYLASEDSVSTLAEVKSGANADDDYADIKKQIKQIESEIGKIRKKNLDKAGMKQDPAGIEDKIAKKYMDPEDYAEWKQLKEIKYTADSRPETGDIATNKHGATFVSNTNGLSGYVRMGDFMKLFGYDPTKNTCEDIDLWEKGGVKAAAKDALTTRQMKKDMREIYRTGKGIRQEAKAYGEALKNARTELEKMGIPELNHESKKINRENWMSLIKQLQKLTDGADMDNLYIAKDTAHMLIKMANVAKTQNLFQRGAAVLSSAFQTIQEQQMAGGASWLNAFTIAQVRDAIMSDWGLASEYFKACADMKNNAAIKDFYIQNHPKLAKIMYATDDATPISDLMAAVSSRPGVDDGGVLQATTTRLLGQSTQEWTGPKSVLKDLKGYADTIFSDATFRGALPVLRAKMLVANYDNAVRMCKDAFTDLTTEEIENLAAKMSYAKVEMFFNPSKTLTKGGFEGYMDKVQIQKYNEVFNRLSGLKDTPTLMDKARSVFFALGYKMMLAGRVYTSPLGVKGDIKNVFTKTKDLQPTDANINEIATRFMQKNDRLYSMVAVAALAAISCLALGIPTAWDDLNFINPIDGEPQIPPILQKFQTIGQIWLPNAYDPETGFYVDKSRKMFGIDTMSSTFTLQNSLLKTVDRTINSNAWAKSPQRGLGFVGGVNSPINQFLNLDPVKAIGDELIASNLLSPYRALYEVVMDTTYFGNNVWEKKYLPDGSENKNYDPMRNVIASVIHLTSLDFGISDGTNAYVKGKGTPGYVNQDRIGTVAGSGIFQHEYSSAAEMITEGKYLEAIIEGGEVPLKTRTLSSEARTEFNNTVKNTIASYMAEYRARAEGASASEKDAIYADIVKKCADVVAKWSAKWEYVFGDDQNLVPYATRMLMRLTAGEYDDNLDYIQNAYWKAEDLLQIQHGTFSFLNDDDLADWVESGKTIEEFNAEKQRRSDAYNQAVDDEWKARMALIDAGYDESLLSEYAYADIKSASRAVSKKVFLEVQHKLESPIGEFKNFKEMKKYYEAQIAAATSTKQKAKLANQYNTYVTDVLAPYVDPENGYGASIINDVYYNGQGLANSLADYIILPADQYYSGKSPRANYLRDLFGVGYRNTKNLPSDEEVIEMFASARDQIIKGATASASSILERLIEQIKKGRYYASDLDYSKIIKLKAQLGAKE